MRRLLTRLRTAQNDEGSALIVALVVVLAVAIMMTAVIDFAGTGITSGIQLRDLRNINYYTEGAVDGAINQIRGSSNTTCTDYRPPAPPSTIKGATGHTYKVTCDMQPGSGGGGEQPSFAVLTLSNQPNEGFIATGNKDLTIDGGVTSNREISMQHNTMTVNGTVSAWDACSPTAPAEGGGAVTSTDPASMSCGSHALTPDPNYNGRVSSNSDLNDLIASSAADPKPNCLAGNKVAQFQPGYYTEQPGTLLKDFASDCSAAHVWWFQPGAYFFNFPGTWFIGSPCPSGPATPCADDVVGGVPTDTGSTPLGFTDWKNGVGTPEDDWTHKDPSTGRSYPACKNDVTSTSYGGVQFEFGGASRLKTSSSGGIELCGPTNEASQAAMVQQTGGGKQHIVFQSVSNSTASPVTPPASPEQFLWNSAPALAGWDSGSTGAAAQTPGDLQTDTATLSSGQSATLTYTGANSDASTSPATQIPDGAKITKVEVRVYQAITGGPDAQLNITGSHTGATPQAVTVPSTCAGVDTNYVDSLPYCDVQIDSALSAPEWKDLQGATIQYVASAHGGGGSGVVKVDALALRVSYTAPNADNNSCTLTSSCVVWDSTVNLDAFLHGTSYAPTGEMDVEVQGSSGTIFDRGVIAATLHANIVASSTQTESPFELPSGTPNGRLALFTGYVDADIRVRACVLYQDYNTLPGGFTQAFPGYKVQVQSWNVIHGGTTGTPSC